MPKKCQTFCRNSKLSLEFAFLNTSRFATSIGEGTNHDLIKKNEVICSCTNIKKGKEGKRDREKKRSNSETQSKMVNNNYEMIEEMVIKCIESIAVSNQKNTKQMNQFTNNLNNIHQSCAESCTETDWNRNASIESSRVNS